MSEPGSKPQVDDVLASIRRLVAREDRGSPDRTSSSAGGPDRPAGHPGRGGGSKLILTSSFRVDASAGRMQEGDTAAGRSDKDRSHVLPLVASARLPQPGGADKSSGSAPEPATASDLSNATDLPDEHAVSGSGAGGAGGAPGTPGQAGGRARDRASWTEADLRSKIEALQAAIVRGDEVRPSESQEIGGAPDLPDPSPAGEGDIPEEKPYRLEPDARRDAADETAEPTPDPGDEEALRAIVAQLVREELKGELGARITRNIRKLVRQEVLKVIESRKLE